MSALGHEHKNTFTYTWEIIANSKRGKKKKRRQDVPGLQD